MAIKAIALAKSLLVTLLIHSTVGFIPFTIIKNPKTASV